MSIRRDARSRRKKPRLESLANPEGFSGAVLAGKNPFQDTDEVLKRFARHGGPDLSDLRGFPDMSPRIDGDGDGDDDCEMLSFHSSLETRTPSCHRESNSEAQRDIEVSPTPSCGQILPCDRTTQGKISSATTPRQPHKLDVTGVLVQNGIFSHGQAARPHNEDDIRAALGKRRDSIRSLTGEDFAAFCERTRRAETKPEVITAVVFPFLLGDYRKMVWGGERFFDNMEPLQDDAVSPLTVPAPEVEAAQPDLVDGVDARVLYRDIQDELDRYVVPSSYQKRNSTGKRKKRKKKKRNSCANEDVVVPNFFVQVAAYGDDIETTMRLARYYGAFGARAIEKLKRWRQEKSFNAPATSTSKISKISSDYPERDGAGSAYTIVAGYAQGTLRLESVHAGCSSHPRRPVEFHCTELGLWRLTDGLETFRQGIAAFRNARDWARTQRDVYVVLANLMYIEEKMSQR